MLTISDYILAFLQFRFKNLHNVQRLKILRHKEWIEIVTTMENLMVFNLNIPSKIHPTKPITEEKYN